MKETPLTAIHQGMGAKMSPFAGYLMPISYAGIKDEHRAVREGVGLFDVSHMGEFIVRGKEALDFLQYVTTNDVSKLDIGQAQYNCFPNGKGGIVDDLLIYRLTEDNCSEGERAYMLVVNASNIQKDWDWLESHNRFDTRLINISDQTALLAVQGPKATEVVQKLSSINLDDLAYYTHTKGQVAGIDNVLISATGYTGSGGYELYVENGQAAQLWEALMTAGADQGIQACGLGARDTLRLEMGYCLYGNDIDDNTSPLEAGLGWITKLAKGDFIDRDHLAQQKEAGLNLKLVGFKLSDRRAPRNGYGIEDADGNTIGRVTSGTISPSLGYPIGMGYVPLSHAKIGTEIFIQTGRKRLNAIVNRPPFYRKD